MSFDKDDQMERDGSYARMEMANIRDDLKNVAARMLRAQADHDLHQYLFAAHGAVLCAVSDLATMIDRHQKKAR